MQKVSFLFFILILIFLSFTSKERKNTVNQIDMCMFNYINRSSDASTKPDAAIINWPRWSPGQVIKIKFLDGDDATHQKVKRIANEWTNYANLKFEYVDVNEDADIRIGFQTGTSGAWSFLGMRSAYGDRNEQSMRLGPLTANEASIRRTILHEFGHALGLIHENASPGAKINWDLPKVYKYYNDLNGWSKEEVDRFVIKSPESTNYTEYDPLSIMHYYVDPALTTDGVRVNEMNVLSETDKKSINMWYPFPIKSIVDSGERIDEIKWGNLVKSPNGEYSLNFAAGYLCVAETKTNKIIWGVGNPTLINTMCTLQLDGNIVIKGVLPALLFAEQTIFWTSETSGFPGATLNLQNDGDLQLIYNGAVKWSSKNGKS